LNFTYSMNSLSKMNQNDVCIPNVKADTPTHYIKSIFQKTHIGSIIRYKEFVWKNDSSMKRILMTIEWNTKHPKCVSWKEMLRNGNSICIVYDFPKEWKMCLAKN